MAYYYVRTTVAVACCEVFIIICLSPSFAITEGTFRSVPTTVKTFENDTVLLPCYHSTPFFSVRWFRGESLLADSTRPEVTPPDRIRMWGNGSLQVSQVEASDSGEYSCHIQTEGGMAKQFHAIEVQYPPSVVPIPASGVLEIALGGHADMLCKAAGVPPPIITWNSKGQELELLDSRPRLNFKVTSVDLEGEYECTASNGVGKPATAKIELRVLSFPVLTTPAVSVHTRVGMRAQLECIVTSRPPATIHWFRSGQPINTSSGGRIVKMDGEISSEKSSVHHDTQRGMEVEAVRKSVIIIRNVRDSDLGLYECRAENRIGVQILFMELTGVPLPAIFKSTATPTLSETAAPPNGADAGHPGVVTAPTSISHTLIWQTESLSPIIEYRLDFRAIHTGDISDPSKKLKAEWNVLTIPGELQDGNVHIAGYALRGLMPATLYEAKVRSRNRYGWSEDSPVLRFATGGEPHDRSITELIQQDTETSAETSATTDSSLTSSCTSVVFSKINVILCILIIICLK